MSAQPTTPAPYQPGDPVVVLGQVLTVDHCEAAGPFWYVIPTNHNGTAPPVPADFVHPVGAQPS